MERMLEKLARQLNSLDEASLMSLWKSFAGRVENFEPTKRWEEAALCLCLCQAVRWKNQLFNHHFAASLTPRDDAARNAEENAPPKRAADRADEAGGDGGRVLPAESGARAESPPKPDPFRLRIAPGTGKKQASSRPGKVIAFGGAGKSKPQP